eukprot:c19087_g2_i1 orf=1917-2558(+)
MDELTRNVSTRKLKRVRSLKSVVTCCLGRVQKVRDEIEHLLDDDKDMADMYLTRKHILRQQDELNSSSSPRNPLRVSQLSSRCSSNASLVGNVDNHNVDQLEMLLEAYLVQVEGTRKKILAVREYINDTEDYVYILLKSRRNKLIQLQVILKIVSFCTALVSACVGALSMNIPCPLYTQDGIYTPVVITIVSVAIAVFFILLGHARRKGLFIQ